MTLSPIDESLPLPDASQQGGTGAGLCWRRVCAVKDILPDTGVCALVEDQQVAVFRIGGADGEAAGHEVGSDEGDESDATVFAISNIDPYANASVLSRGLIGSLGERLVVASPLYKHHFDLRTGECLESPAHRVRCFDVRVESGEVWIGI